MATKDNSDKYFYDFGEMEPSEELTSDLEPLNELIHEKKTKILKQRDNLKKAKQLRTKIKTDKE